MVKANDDGACLRLAHAQVENEIQARPRRAPRRGARGHRTSEDCARSPYGESTFKRNRPSFAVLMVLGGGGGDSKSTQTLSTALRTHAHTYTHINSNLMACLRITWKEAEKARSVYWRLLEIYMFNSNIEREGWDAFSLKSYIGLKLGHQLIDSCLLLYKANK